MTEVVAHGGLTVKHINISGLRERGKISVSLPNWRLSGLAGKKKTDSIKSTVTI